ncbi:BMP family ABC transporter substrate-binding protein [Agromyces seonyuensis]|uniref:BMP family ABC transporter substrate-binding protein n=1 Tax=Agromyces seonyuensis TaxID=2662446 RepID=A0A6I4NU79_9MICO|nr:BMP family ABC transporter substrate-binding protein [Agromyces seonyuensis]MWB97938.1 BMP family ABC transporter substrate-binding protein [Agromyces seonyuensis]
MGPVGLAAIALLLAGCATTPSAGSAEALLGGGPSPSPEATVEPPAGSWNGVTPPEGYRAVLVVAGDDPATTTIAAAVEGWAVDHEVEIDRLDADDDTQVLARLEEADGLDADLVIGAGAGVVDEFSYATAQRLDQQFLVVGAQLGEPTRNVTAVVWPGATFRGTGITDDEQDAAAVTPEAAGDAVDAGVASVLAGLTGIVLALP